MRHLTLALVLTAPVVAADPAVKEQTLFAAGDGGYHTYRIPSLITTKGGVVLAFCEGRKNNRGDAGDIDLVLRRSADGGKTWGKLQVVWDEADNTCGNPCPVVDQKTGTVWLLMTHNLRIDTEAKIVAGTGTGSRTVWVTRSTDDGATWEKPVEITRDVKKPDWTWYATGPGVGIQLRTGRLLAPCDHKADGGKVRRSHVVYSDDGGKTWRIGGSVGPECNECQAAELSDGRVLLNMRTFRKTNRRLVAISSDGGETFGEPADDPALVEPACQASLIRLDKGALAFSNPASTKREKLTVRFSPDDGKTWPHARLLHDGPAAYSCLTVLPDGHLGCLYECGEKGPYERIVLARFGREWVAGK
jgi:sialidase-1